MRMLALLLLSTTVAAIATGAAPLPGLSCTLRDQPAAVEWRFAKETAADCPQAP